MLFHRLISNFCTGMSPLRAAFEDVSLISDYAAFKQAKFQNRAIPDAIVSPDEVIGEEKRDLLHLPENAPNSVDVSRQALIIHPESFQ